MVYRQIDRSEGWNRQGSLKDTHSQENKGKSMKELFPEAADLGNYLLGKRREGRISKRMEVEGSQILKSPLTIITRKTWVWK